MSNNVNETEMMSGKLAIKATDAAYFLDGEGGDLPEISFFEDIEKDVRSALRAGQIDKLIDIEDLTWEGSWSGNSFEMLVKEICPKLVGKAKVRYHFEEGGTVLAIENVDGKVSVKQRAR